MVLTSEQTANIHEAMQCILDGFDFLLQNSQIHVKATHVKTQVFVSVLEMDTRADVDLPSVALVVNIVNVSVCVMFEKSSLTICRDVM